VPIRMVRVGVTISTGADQTTLTGLEIESRVLQLGRTLRSWTTLPMEGMRRINLTCICTLSPLSLPKTRLLD
jgi:hypothetical protein